MGFRIRSPQWSLLLLQLFRWRQSFAGAGRSWSYSRTRSRGGMAGDVHGWWSAIALLPKVVARLQRVQILCEPAIDAIRRFDHPDALIYGDPPYVQSTRNAHSRSVYCHEMSDDEHREHAALLRKCRGSVVVSGYPSTLYTTLYRDWRRITKTVPVHASRGRTKHRRTECLWMNF